MNEWCHSWTYKDFLNKAFSDEQYIVEQSSDKGCYQKTVHRGRFIQNKKTYLNWHHSCCPMMMKLLNRPGRVGRHTIMSALTMSSVTNTYGFCLCFPSGRVESLWPALHIKKLSEVFKLMGLIVLRYLVDFLLFDFPMTQTKYRDNINKGNNILLQVEYCSLYLFYCKPRWSSG